MDEVQLFKHITVLSLEQATVLPYLTLRLAEEGANVIRMERRRRSGDGIPQLPPGTGHGGAS